MVVSDPEDTLTEINTALNKSMVLMEERSRKSPKLKEKSRKSIKINPITIQGSSTPIQEQSSTRKSILKKPERERVRESEASPKRNLSFNNSQNGENNEESTPKFVRRPHNLEEFMLNEDLIFDGTQQTYTLNDVDEDDELWLIEVPKSVNPHELKGQLLYLGEKTKLQLGEEKYQATTHSTSDCLTCVFGTGNEEKPYKIVNIRPSGTVTMRRRLLATPIISNSGDELVDNTAVPFPKGLKQRDPIAGVSDNGKIKKKTKSRLKKRESLIE